MLSAQTVLFLGLNPIIVLFLLGRVRGAVGEPTSKHGPGPGAPPSLTMIFLVVVLAGVITLIFRRRG